MIAKGHMSLFICINVYFGGNLSWAIKIKEKEVKSTVILKMD